MRSDRIRRSVVFAAFGVMLGMLPVFAGTTDVAKVDSAAAVDSVRNAWLPDYDKAVKTAQDQHKDILVLFTSSDSDKRLCRAIEGRINDPEFIKSITNDFVLLYMDKPEGSNSIARLPEGYAEQRDRLMDEFGIYRFPMFSMLSSSGRSYGSSLAWPEPPQKLVKKLHESQKKGHACQAEEQEMLANAESTADKLQLMDKYLSGMSNYDAVFKHLSLLNDVMRLDADDKAGLKTKYKAMVIIGHEIQIASLVSPKVALEHIDKSLADEHFSVAGELLLLEGKVTILIQVAVPPDFINAAKALGRIIELDPGAKTKKGRWAQSAYPFVIKRAQQQQRKPELIKKIDNGDVHGAELAKLLDELICVKKAKYEDRRKTVPWRLYRKDVKRLLEADPQDVTGLKTKYEPEYLLGSAQELARQGQNAPALKKVETLLKKYPPQDKAKMQDVLLFKARLMESVADIDRNKVEEALKDGLAADPGSDRAVAIKKDIAGAHKTTSCSWVNAKFGDNLVSADGTESDAEYLKNKDVIGIYFSAPWCGACHLFTPKLVAAYNEWKKQNRSIEVVFASCDRSADSTLKYMKDDKMPWKALPDYSDRRDEIAQLYEIHAIPQFIILNGKTGALITADGYSDVLKNKSAAIGGWIKSAQAADRVDYAVLMSKSAAANKDWKAVGDALAEKYKNTRVYHYTSSPLELREKLAKANPRYMALVLPPCEIDKQKVWQINRLSRLLDDDPYGDCMWGIITGYAPADAMRIVKTKEPLQIKNGFGTTGFTLENVENVLNISDAVCGEFLTKSNGGEPVKATHDPKDPGGVTYLLQDFWSKNHPELFVTSGHATQYNLEMSWGHGLITCSSNRFYVLTQEQRKVFAAFLNGVIFEGRENDIVKYVQQCKAPTLEVSETPKIWIGAGNCLLGDIKKSRNTMAVTALSAGGFRQLVGYTVTTWFGRMGWGTLGRFQDAQHLTLSEAFFFSNQALLEESQRRYPGLLKIEYDSELSFFKYIRTEDFQQVVNESGIPRLDKDSLGLIHDRDVVAFYGDPRWEARMPGAPDIKAATNKIQDGLEISITTTAGFKAGSGFSLFFDEKIADPKLDLPEGWEYTLTDDFLLVSKSDLKPGETRKLVIK